jgi:MFS family permease
MLEFGIGKGTAALVQSCVLAGAILGALLTGLSADHYGRKICTILCILIGTFLGVMHFFVPGGNVGLTILLMLRACLGVLFSGINLLQTVIAFEFVPDSWRAAMNVLQGLGWSVASIVCWLCLQGFELQWRTALGVFLSAAGLLALGPVCLMSETPRWLFIKGYPEEGYRIFQKMLNSTLLMGQDCGLSSPPHVVVPLGSGKESKVRTMWTQIPILLDSNFRRTTCVGCLMWICTAGNSYSYFLWLPTVIKDVSGAAAHDYQLFIVAELVAPIAAILSIWTRYMWKENCIHCKRHPCGRVPRTRCAFRIAT